MLTYRVAHLLSATASHSPSFSLIPWSGLSTTPDVSLLMLSPIRLPAAALYRPVLSLLAVWLCTARSIFDELMALVRGPAVLGA